MRAGIGGRERYWAAANLSIDNANDTGRRPAAGVCPWLNYRPLHSNVHWFQTMYYMVENITLSLSSEAYCSILNRSHDRIQRGEVRHRKSSKNGKHLHAYYIPPWSVHSSSSLDCMEPPNFDCPLCNIHTNDSVNLDKAIKTKQVSRTVLIIHYTIF